MSNKVRTAFLCILALMLISGCGVKPDRVCLKNTCFSIELARTSAEYQRGLQMRQSLADDAGMLFVFKEKGYDSFWMKDTLIPLDMLWLDRDGTILHIENAVPPCEKEPCPVYSPAIMSSYVLELNAGTCRRLGVELGDRACLSVRDPRI